MNLKSIDYHIATIDGIDLAKLRTEALHFAKVCQDNPTRADGYPTKASGADPYAGGGSRAQDDRTELGYLTEDQYGHAPASSDTSVESAALAEKKARDEIDMKTAVALQNIATAAAALQLAVSKLGECRNLQAQASVTEKPECWVMRQRAGVNEEARSNVKTDLNGALDEPRHVCKWVREFHAANQVLPTREQCRAHARGDRVMVST